MLDIIKQYQQCFVNDINASIKKNKWSEWIKKHNITIRCL